MILFYDLLKLPANGYVVFCYKIYLILSESFDNVLWNIFSVKLSNIFVTHVVKSIFDIKYKFVEWNFVVIEYL